MYIREALPSEYDAIATVATQAMVDDEIDAYLFPARRAHPAVYHQLYLDRVREHAKQPYCFLIVAESEPTDACWNGQARIAGQPPIAGYSMWVREGHWVREGDCEWTFATRRTREGFSARILNWFKSCTFLDDLTLLLNPAACVIRSLRYGREYDKFFDPSYQNPEQQWTVLELAVSPKCQRDSVGMRLLEWGMVRARKQQVPITLTSTAAGRRLYDDAGFWNYGTWRWAKGEDRVCALMRWDPPELNP